MMGTIGIEALSISCIVGILPHERIEEQELIINLEMDLSFEKLMQEQNIEDTIDYAELSIWLEAWIQEKQFFLLESLAEQVSARLLERYSSIEVLRFEVRKPAAIPNARAAVISVERRR